MKLFDLLETLNKSELKSFGKYIKAIIKDEKAYLLYQEVRKLYPNFKAPKEFKEKLYKKIYGHDNKYNSRKINYLISDVTQALEDYFIILQTRRNPISRKFLLMEYYKEAQNSKYFHKIADEVLSDVGNDSIKGGKHYLEKMRIHYDLYFDVPADRNRISTHVDLANNMIESLDEFYIYYKLKVETDLKSFSGYNMNKKESFIIKELLNNIPSHDFHKNKLVDIYHYYLKNHKDDDEVFYLTLKEKVLQNIDNLPKVHQKDLFTILSNYTLVAKRNNVMPNSSFYALEILQLGIDKEYSIHEGKLDFQQFTNAMIFAIGENRIEWVKKIIREKGHLLDEKLRSDTIKLARSNIAYAEKRYMDVLYELNTIEQFRHYSIAYQSRFILLKTYFELAILGEKMSDEIYNFIPAYKSHIRRSNILGPKQKTSVLQAIKYITRILDNFHLKKESWENIENDITNSKIPIGATPWIRSKIEYFKHKGHR